MPRYNQVSTYRKRKWNPDEDRTTKRAKKGWSVMKRSSYVNPNLKAQNFTRHFHVASYTWSTASVTGFWNVLQMSASQIPNWTDYTNLFQEFKINGIEVTFVPRYDGVDQTGSLGGALPMIHYKVETPRFLTPTGAYSASTLNAYLDTNPTSVAFTKPIKCYFKPTLPADINNTVAEIVPSAWLLTGAGNTILHSGISFFVNFTGFITPTAAFTTDVYYKFYFQTRNPA